STTSIQMNIKEIIESFFKCVFSSGDGNKEEVDTPMENRPKKTKSLAQQRRHELFREAVAFAKVQVKDPTKKKFFSDRAKPGQHAYLVAMSMFLRLLGPNRKFTIGL
ncbi:MAG: hypothetical protein ABJA70_21025, partial [Chryseolinea sp.]